MYCKIKIMKKFILSLILLITGTFLFAQSADVVTKIIEADQVTFGQVCYMSATHQKLISDKASLTDAIRALQRNNQISKEYEADSVPTLEEISAIILKMWPQVNDSLMFRITKGNSRYAFKLLKAKGVIRASADPKQTLSGRDFLNLLTSAMMTFDPQEEGMTMEVNE